MQQEGHPFNQRPSEEGFSNCRRWSFYTDLPHHTLALHFFALNRGLTQETLRKYQNRSPETVLRMLKATVKTMSSEARRSLIELYGSSDRATMCADIQEFLESARERCNYPEFFWEAIQDGICNHLTTPAR